MEHILSLLFAIIRYPALLVGAWIWTQASRRFLAEKPGKLAWISRLMLYWAAMAGPMWIGDENLLFYLPAFVGIFLWCYQGTRPARAVTGIVFYLLLSGVGMILDSGLNISINGTWDWSDSLVCGLKVLSGVLVFLLSAKLNPEGKPLKLSDRLWGLCALLSLAPLIMVLSFSLWNGFGRAGMDEGQYRIAYTVLPFVILSAMALLVAMAVLSHHEELEQAARLAQMRGMYYEGLQSKETQVRTLRHDLRNHLNAVQGLLAQGETEQAQGYLSELAASPALHGTKRICENELANVVLTEKLEEMDRCGLEPDILVALPKSLSVADTDLCALLGNALDNAIEAGRKAQDNKILIRMRADRGMLMLRVENCCAEAPTEKNGAFATSKADTSRHGFGISGMREIATRYGGTLETRVQDGRFELVACLPLAQAGSAANPAQKSFS
jgi:two-component system sensor histidine kinase AgrC